MITSKELCAGPLTGAVEPQSLIECGLVESPSLTDFSGRSAVGVLALAVRGSMSCTLLFESPDFEAIALRLVGGEVVTSGQSGVDENEALLNELLNHHDIPREGLLLAANHCDQTGERLGPTMLSRKLAPAKALVTAHRRIHGQRLMTVTRGPVHYLTAASEKTIPGDPRQALVAMPVRPVVYKAVRAALSEHHLATLEPALAPIAERWVKLEPGRLVGFGLTSKEKHPLEKLFDGSYTAAEVTDLALMTRREILRMILALVVSGAITLLDAPLGDRRETPLERVQEALDRALEADAFERLAAHWTSHSTELQTGYTKLRRQYGSGGTARKDAASAAVCDQIIDLVEQAREETRTLEQRRALRMELVDHAKLTNSADLLYNQGRTEEFRENYQEAIRAYEVVFELRPDKKVVDAIARARAKQAGLIGADVVNVDG